MPETPAVNALPQWFRERAERINLEIGDVTAAGILATAADYVERALARERAPHEEMARELHAEWCVDERRLEACQLPMAECEMFQAIAATLASVARTPWQRCPKQRYNTVNTGHLWPSSELPQKCISCGVHRAAVDPAGVPQGETDEQS